MPLLETTLLPAFEFKADKQKKFVDVDFMLFRVNELSLSLNADLH